MIVNFKKQSNIGTFSRARGGWCKKITGVDRTQYGGYSILGDFLKLGNFDTYLTNGVYLDVSKSGRGKEKPDVTYNLFKVENEEISLIKTITNPENNWTLEFWDIIEEELNSNKVTAQTLYNLIHEKTDDEETIKELINILTKDTEYRGFRNHFELKSYMYDIPCLELDYKYFDKYSYDGDYGWGYANLDVNPDKVNNICFNMFHQDPMEVGNSIHMDIKEITSTDIKSFEFRRELIKTMGNEAGFYFTQKGSNAVGTMNRNIVVLCGFNKEENAFVVRHFDYYD